MGFTILSVAYPLLPGAREHLRLVKAVLEQIKVDIVHFRDLDLFGYLSCVL